MSKIARKPRFPAAAAVAALAALLAISAQPAAAASGVSDSGWERKVEASVLGEAAWGQTDFLVYLSRQADLSQAAALETKLEKGRFVYERLTSVARATQPSVTAVLDGLGIPYQTFWVVNAIWVRGGREAVEAMARHPQVESVYAAGRGQLAPPVEVQPAPMSAEAVEAIGSNIAKVRAPEAWALGFTGQGVTVAGADTGVFWTHSALKSKYRGWDGVSANHNYNWHDAIKNPNTACPGSSPEPCDDDAVLGGGHGTHTVGTMVGDDGGANQIGMAPGARWVACRNMNNGLGVVPTYLECMEWFLAPTDSNGQNPDPSKSPHVINNSWACVEGCAPPLLKAQIDASRAAGIVYVVSAGNEGQAGCSTIAFPLMVYRSAFTVGATNIGNDVIASFSSRGPVLTNPLEGVGYRKPDISAPGVSVRSALRNGSYGNLSGTSMAGPHVAGLVALIISARPSLAGNVDRIEQLIEQTAVPLTTNQGCGGDSPTAVPNNVYGWGRIDALAAVLAAMNKPPDAVDDSATTDHDTPVTIDVLANDSDPDGTQLTVTAVTNGGSGSAANNGDGTVTYSPNAGFAGTDTFTYTIGDGEGGSDTATVTVTVEPPPAAADLQVSNVVAANAKPREGDRVTITATISNTGTAAAAASKTEFLLDGSSLLGLLDTPGIPAGESANVSIAWDTRGVRGEHTIRVTADRAEAVAESAEGNNAGIFTATVQGNKVKNGSFEQSNSSGDAPEGWSGSSTGAGEASWEGGGSDGGRSAGTSGNGGNAAASGSPSWTSEPIAVTPGETLTLRLSIEAIGASSAPGAGLVYLGAAGSVVGSVNLLTAPLTTAGYATLERAVTIPAGVAQVRVTLVGFAPTDLATRGTVRFDDVGLFGQ